MGTAMREVMICDVCGSDDGISYWFQIGEELCEGCATDAVDNHQCKTCADFDINFSGPLVKVDGRNKCPNCIEDAEDEARWLAEDAAAEAVQ